MTPAPDALDESWGRISGAAAQRAKLELIYGYLSHDPSKNLTSANIRDYHQHGVGVWNGWESTTGRPFDGRSAGEVDAAAAVAQIRAHIRNLGYGPGNSQVIPHSLDQDLPASRFSAALPYYQGARHVYQQEAGWDVGAYGKLAFLDFLADEGFTRGLFGTYAWQNARAISPHIALFQYQNGQTLGGASVDFDRVLHADQIGAWWPPGHPLNEGDDMPLTDQDIARIWAYPMKGDPDATGKQPTHNMSTWLVYAAEHAQGAIHAAAGNGTKLDSLLRIVGDKTTGIGVRVTQLQAAVARVQAPAQATASEIVAELKKLVWGVK